VALFVSGHRFQVCDDQVQAPEDRAAGDSGGSAPEWVIKSVYIQAQPWSDDASGQEDVGFR
jgi:hypothetical protein